MVTAGPNPGPVDCGKQRDARLTAAYVLMFPKATIRPEFRLDFSSLDDYGELDDPTSTQPSIGIGATYAF